MQRRIAIVGISFLAFFCCQRRQSRERKWRWLIVRPPAGKLAYDCMITLTDKTTGAPVLDGEFTVSADMPSMPGVHNVEPVLAQHHRMGMYRAHIELEMYGEWVLVMDFTKPKGIVL
jgi:hypothetical protein